MNIETVTDKAPLYIAPDRGSVMLVKYTAELETKVRELSNDIDALKIMNVDKHRVIKELESRLSRHNEIMDAMTRTSQYSAKLGEIIKAKDEKIKDLEEQLARQTNRANNEERMRMHYVERLTEMGATMDTSAWMNMEKKLAIAVEALEKYSEDNHGPSVADEALEKIRG